MVMIHMTAVVAMAKNRVIGDGNGLIWHIPDDLKRVKTLTMGRPLIMGRKTWDSIGRPLPGRASIVMTRDADWAADGAIRVSTMTAAIAAAREWIEATAEARPEIILFGGGEIYAQGLDYCHRVERTVINIAADGGNDVDIDDVFMTVDDRQKVVDMWRENGLTCFQVAPGDFK